MKKYRELSGIFFREKIDGKWRNICFEDLPKEKQKEIIDKKSKEFVGNLAISLAGTLKEIGDISNLTKNENYE
jgi:hypothetical protein